MGIIEGIILFFVGSIVVVVLRSILELLQTGIIISALFTGDFIGKKISLTRTAPNKNLVSTGLILMMLSKLCLSIWAFAAVIVFMFEQEIWLDKVVNVSAPIWWLLLVPLTICVFTVGLKSGKENVFQHKEEQQAN